MRRLECEGQGRWVVVGVLLFLIMGRGQKVRLNVFLCAVFDLFCLEVVLCEILGWKAHKIGSWTEVEKAI